MVYIYISKIDNQSLIFKNNYLKAIRVPKTFCELNIESIIFPYFSEQKKFIEKTVYLLN